jgi:hypothetical protein
LTLRFVWEKKQSGNRDKVNPGCAIQLFRLVYNAAWLLPIVLTFGGTLDYTTGLAAFTTVCVVRLIANQYANNVLDADQFNVFLFRA